MPSSPSPESRGAALRLGGFDIASAVRRALTPWLAHYGRLAELNVAIAP